METQKIKIRGVPLIIFYTKTEEGLNIYEIQHNSEDIFDLCEWYNILPDIYEELWKTINS